MPDDVKKIRRRRTTLVIVAVAVIVCGLIRPGAQSLGWQSDYFLWCMLPPVLFFLIMAPVSLLTRDWTKLKLTGVTLDLFVGGFIANAVACLLMVPYMTGWPSELRSGQRLDDPSGQFELMKRRGPGATQDDMFVAAIRDRGLKHDSGLCYVGNDAWMPASDFSALAAKEAPLKEFRERATALGTSMTFGALVTMLLANLLAFSRWFQYPSPQPT